MYARFCLVMKSSEKMQDSAQLRSRVKRIMIQGQTTDQDNKDAKVYANFLHPLFIHKFSISISVDSQFLCPRKDAKRIHTTNSILFSLFVFRNIALINANSLPQYYVVIICCYSLCFSLACLSVCLPFYAWQGQNKIKLFHCPTVGIWVLSLCLADRKLIEARTNIVLKNFDFINVLLFLSIFFLNIFTVFSGISDGHNGFCTHLLQLGRLTHS